MTAIVSVAKNSKKVMTKKKSNLVGHLFSMEQLTLPNSNESL
jgi:hypothetical protein